MSGFYRAGSITQPTLGLIVLSAPCFLFGDIATLLKRCVLAQPPPPLPNFNTRYVAPENVLGRGYNNSVDWWTLGVLMYVLLTARQPFSSPKTADPMEVMRRIVDERWPIKYPPYMSDAAKDLIGRLMERKPARRLGMLQGRAADIKNHKWFSVRRQGDVLEQT